MGASTLSPWSVFLGSRRCPASACGDCSSASWATVPSRAGGRARTKSCGPGRPQLTWALSKRDLAPIEVRNILVRGVGLTLGEAKEVVKRA